jgi:hypothetical protein
MRVFFIALILLTGCQQLMRGQVEQVRLIDGKNKIMQINCTGSASSWGECYGAASQACPNSFEVINRKENITGGFRQLTFKCQ